MTPTTMDISTALVCIKHKQSGQVLRLPKIDCIPYLRQGWHFTTKSVWRRFWKLVIKLDTNQKVLEKHDFSKDQEDNFIYHDEKANKKYAYVKTGESILSYQYKADSEEEKKSAFQSVVDRYFINPNTQNKIAAWFANILSIFGKKKEGKKDEEVKELEKNITIDEKTGIATETVVVPKYQRYLVEDTSLVGK